MNSQKWKMNESLADSILGKNAEIKRRRRRKMNNRIILLFLSVSVLVFLIVSC